MPSILSRTPKPDPKLFYRVVEGFVADRELNYWSPRLNSLYPGSDYRIQWLFANGAADKLVVPDGVAAGRTSSDDDARRQVAAMERRFAAESFENVDPTIKTGASGPPAHQVVCIQRLVVGGGAGVTVFEPGQTFDATLPAVVDHPNHFEPVTKE